MSYIEIGHGEYSHARYILKRKKNVKSQQSDQQKTETTKNLNPI